MENWFHLFFIMATDTQNMLFLEQLAQVQAQQVQDHQLLVIIIQKKEGGRK